MDAVKKLVSGRLKAQAAGTHPDPELLAAFAENSLSGRDRDRMLNHLSACTDCREVLYLAMPDTSEAQGVLAPSSAASSSRWRQPRLALRWATLAASVLLVGSVLVTNRGMFTQHLRSSAAPAKDNAPQQVAELKSPAEVDQIAEAPAIEAAAKVRPQAKHMTAKPYASMQFDQSGQVHFAPTPSANEASQAGGRAEQTAAAPSSMNRADGAVAARSSNATGAAVSKASSSLSSSLSWSLSADGQVQRSFDSGKTWQIVLVADGIPFRAISSIGNDVWVGGAAGTLYHSADSGRSWIKADAAFTGDIAHIEFSDAQNGLVSTAGGEVWSSWRLK
jgi:hypothetical protein